jgi:ribonuclease HI
MLPGEAYVGVRGPQRAEFLAAIHGLFAVVAYVKPLGRSRRPTRVVLRTDSREVVRQLRREAGADVLLPYRQQAEAIIEMLLEMDIGFQIDRVSDREDGTMRAVHGRSREAQRVRKRQGGWPGPPEAIPF